MQTIIQAPTPDLEQSLSFYKKLNFQVIQEGNTVLVSDDQFTIQINPDRMARIGLVLHAANWTDTIHQLKKITPILEIKSGYLVGSPSGVWVYLSNTSLLPTSFDQPIQRTTLGNFAGISIESIPIEQSIEFWMKLGFNEKSGSLDQGWVCVRNAEGFMVSIMKPMSCPHLFFSPGLTFFNGKSNPSIIGEIRAKEIPITEEITHFNPNGEVDNVIIRDPGGLSAFIFND